MAVRGRDELGFIFHSFNHVTYMWIDRLYFSSLLLLKTTVCAGLGSTAESSFVISAAAATGSSSAAVPGSEDENV